MKIMYRQGKSIKCLTAHTYGIVIGLSSSNKLMMKPDMTLDKIEPNNTAVEINGP
jgi:hypothetical protein